ncbi:glycosyltransferase family 39 protein [Streptomyces aureoversilis]|uniref:Glycosyltransferase RgtA/B/C/D-like domain-containing protein n=1 Tax=Streptomyces aureoversilis TaxID=67277 RepID=A0ABW0AAW7_9ACTN
MATSGITERGSFPSAWRGQRWVFAAVALLLLLCAGWTVYGRDALLSAIAACRADRAGCSPARLAELTFRSDGQLRVLGMVSIALPALAGAFWGAPMIARVLETGPGRLPADGAGRVRWYLTRISLAAAGAGSAATLLALLVAWWWRPTANKLYGLNWHEPVILYGTGPAAAAAALFGLAAGTAAGLLVRRTLPAMITTMVGVLGTRWLLHVVHRSAVAPRTYVDGRDTAPDGSWQTSWGYLTSDGGTAPATACPVEQDTAACMNAHGFSSRFTTAYPPGDFWTFQWLDTAALLTLAVALTALVTWRLRCRPPAAVEAAYTLPRRAITVWLVPLVPAAVMLSLGLWGVPRQETMWRDEAATWQAAHRSVPEIWHMLGEVDLVHGLYYVLMHSLFELFGDSLYTLRLPSVLAMAATATFTALIGARLAGRAVGICAGTALALVPAIQMYAQEGRSYSLVTAGTATATWLLVRAFDQPGRRMLWAAYTTAIWVTALLNWFSLFAVSAHAVTLVLTRADRTVLRRWAVAAAVAATGTLPLILASRAQAGQVSWIRPLGWSTLIAPAALLLVGAVCSRLPYRGDGPLTPARLALPLLAVPQAALLLVSTIKPLYLERYLLYTYIGLALLLGVAAAAAIRAATNRRFAQPWLLLPVAVCTAVTLLAPIENRHRDSNGRVDDVIAAAHEVAYYARPGDAVLFLPAARRDTALVAPGMFADLEDIALEQTATEGGTLKGLEIPPAQIRKAMLARKRIILVTDAYAVARPLGTERERAKQQILDRYFHKSHQTQVNGRRITVYDRT